MVERTEDCNNCHSVGGYIIDPVSKERTCLRCGKPFDEPKVGVDYTLAAESVFLSINNMNSAALNIMSKAVKAFEESSHMVLSQDVLRSAKTNVNAMHETELTKATHPTSPGGADINLDEAQKLLKTARSLRDLANVEVKNLERFVELMEGV